MAKDTARRTRTRTVSGSSTEDEQSFSTRSPTESLRRHRNQKSAIFHILRWPLLISVSFLVFLNLACFYIAKSIVNVYEYMLAFLSNSSKIERRMEKANNFYEYEANAHYLDQLFNLDDWKSAPSDEAAFDEDLLVLVTNRLAEYQKKGKLRQLMETLRNSACKQDLAGCESELLYSRTYSGTKYTVDQYVEQVVSSINYVGASPDITDQEKAAFFKQVSVTYGKTALCLSGGATFAWFHLGVMKALWDQGLLPTVISGASAGSLMAAMVCVRTDEELHEVFDPSIQDHINCLADDWSTLFRRFFMTGAFLDPAIYREEADWFCKGDTTFLEAYRRTGRILNVSVMSDESHSKIKVLNYINSPHITIQSAIVASSAIPYLLPACALYYKNEKGQVLRYYGNGRLWRDGSMRQDIPEKELNINFRVKYTIVSQVNPHVISFFYRPKGSSGTPSVHRRGLGWRGGFFAASLVSLFLLESKKWLQFVRDMELLPRINGSNFSNLWLQTFEGSLTIIPKRVRMDNILRFFTDPDYQRMSRFISDGEQATWPAISAIRNRLSIEQTIAHELRMHSNKP